MKTKETKRKGKKIFFSSIFNKNSHHPKGAGKKKNQKMKQKINKSNSNN